MRAFFKRYLKYILSAVVLIGVVIAGFKYVSGREVLNALASFRYTYLLGMLGLAALHLLVRAWLFGLLIKTVKPMPWQLLVRAYISGQAATLLPGGVAARAGLLHQVGMATEKSMAPVLLISLSSQLVLLLGAFVAALFYEPARDTAFWIAGGLGVLGLLLFIQPLRQWLGKRAEALAKRFDKQDAWHTFTKSAKELLTPSRLAFMVALNLLAALLQAAILGLTTAGLGMPLPIFRILLVYFIPTALGRLSGLPLGGIGVTDASMIGLLAVTNAANPNTATAAVAVYRATTIFFPALLGAIVYFLAWRGRFDDSKEEETSTEDSSDLKTGA